MMTAQTCSQATEQTEIIGAFSCRSVSSLKSSPPWGNREQGIGSVFQQARVVLVVVVIIMIIRNELCVPPRPALFPAHSVELEKHLCCCPFFGAKRTPCRELLSYFHNCQMGRQQSWRWKTNNVRQVSEGYILLCHLDMDQTKWSIQVSFSLGFVGLFLMIRPPCNTASSVHILRTYIQHTVYSMWKWDSFEVLSLSIKLQGRSLQSPDTAPSQPLVLSSERFRKHQTSNVYCRPK